MQKGVSIESALDNLNILIGSTYEQGFIRFNQFYKVYVQAWPEFRRMPEDLDNLFVKNDKGEMVPYSAFMKLKKTAGAERDHPLQPVPLGRHSGCAGSRLLSSGQAIEAIREVADETLPRGYAWAGRASRRTSRRRATRRSTSS